MRNWIGILAVGLALLSGCAANQGNTALLNGRLHVSEEGKYYKVQLEALVRDSVPVVPYTNWMQFRKSFFKCRLQNPKNLGVPSAVSMELMTAVHGGYETKYAQMAYDVLEHDYTSIAAHEELSNNLSIAPNVREFHAAVHDALLKSIINSGDGQTPETALFVISIVEEYQALAAMGLTVDGQRLVHKGNHHYDVLTAHNKEGETRDVYFAIDTFYGMFY